ncbi:hypothetical protein LINGRAHAP2_LOCUS11135 [Linum grandiflorum]
MLRKIESTFFSIRKWPNGNNFSPVIRSPSWIAPPPGWVKINYDAAKDEKKGMQEIGWISRNQNGSNLDFDTSEGGKPTRKTNDKSEKVDSDFYEVDGDSYGGESEVEEQRSEVMGRRGVEPAATVVVEEE